MNVLLYGWFGENNFGDELLLRSAIEMLKPYEDVKICVTCSNPNQVNKNYNELYRVSSCVYPSIKRIGKLLLTDPIQVFKNLIESDILVVAGGGAISDWNDVSTKEMFFLINYFSYKKKKIYLFGVGAGPLTKEKPNGRYSTILSKAQIITTRDDYSYNELKKLGLTNIVKSKDLSYNSSIYDKDANEPINIKKVGIILAPVCMNTPDVFDKFIEESRKLIRSLSESYSVSLIPFHPSYDKLLLEQVALGIEDINILQSDNIWKVEQFVSEQDLIIGMRYHSLILAILKKKYLIPIIYHPKNASFCKDFDLMQYSSAVGNGENWPLNNIDADKILMDINKIKNDSSYFQRLDINVNKKLSGTVEQEILENIFKCNE